MGLVLSKRFILTPLFKKASSLNLLCNTFELKFIDDNIMRDEIKRNVKKFVNKNIGLKPLTYVEIVRI